MSEEILERCRERLIEGLYLIHKDALALMKGYVAARKLLDGEHHKPGAFDRMTDWAQQMENERDAVLARVAELEDWKHERELEWEERED